MTRRRLSRLTILKILGLTVLAIVLLVAMAALGRWQLDSYHQQQRDEATQEAHEPPVALDRVLGPDQAFTGEAQARPVVARGEYAGPQLLVDRGADRPWVLTPLVTRTGSAILVVRGLADPSQSTADPAAGSAAPPAPPQGQVRVVGSLQPSQARVQDPDLADHRVPSVSTASLISEYDADLYSGYLVLTDQQPPSMLPKASPPPPPTSATTGLRNLMYALQWWVFAGFVAFMWWRIVRDQLRVP